MVGLALALSITMVGVDYGWEKRADGQIEYIIQIEPWMIDSLKSGIPVTSEIAPDLPGVRSFKIQVGTGVVPRDQAGAEEFKPADKPESVGGLLNHSETGGETVPSVESHGSVVQTAFDESQSDEPSAESELVAPAMLSDNPELQPTELESDDSSFYNQHDYNRDDAAQNSSGANEPAEPDYDRPWRYSVSPEIELVDQTAPFEPSQATSPSSVFPRTIDDGLPHGGNPMQSQLRDNHPSAELPISTADKRSDDIRKTINDNTRRIASRLDNVNPNSLPSNSNSRENREVPTNSADSKSLPTLGWLALFFSIGVNIVLGLFTWNTHTQFRRLLDDLRQGSAPMESSTNDWHRSSASTA